MQDQTRAGWDGPILPAQVAFRLSLWRSANTRDACFETLHSGQFTLSTQLSGANPSWLVSWVLQPIIPRLNCPISLHEADLLHWTDNHSSVDSDVDFRSCCEYVLRTTLNRMLGGIWDWVLCEAFLKSKMRVNWCTNQGGFQATLLRERLSYSSCSSNFVL